MWDIYRTQLPLLTALFPERAVELANALLNVCEEEGNLPIGYRMAKGADRFSRQGSALAHTFLADLCHARPARASTGTGRWCHMDADLRRTYGEEFLLRGVAHPITHTLDLAFGYRCTAQVARARRRPPRSPTSSRRWPTQWVNAFDPATGLLVDSSFYEGGRWNYSFRVLHDMAGPHRAGRRRGGLHRPARRVLRLRRRARHAGRRAAGRRGAGRGLRARPLRGPEQRARHGGALGLPLRSAAPTAPPRSCTPSCTNMFGIGRGGLPGNDDSGGLSSWYVWASLGLFPVAGQGAAPGQRAVVRPVADPAGRRASSTSTTTGFVEPVAGRRRRSTCSR